MDTQNRGGPAPPEYGEVDPAEEAPKMATELEHMRTTLISLILSDGYERRSEPFSLSSGGTSHDYVDGKRAVATTERLKLLGHAIHGICVEEGVTFQAVGGMTMGADPIALSVVMTAPEGDEKSWFSVRKEPKGHGTEQSIEGPRLAPGTKVLLVDDVVTTGRSITRAMEAVMSRSVEVVFAVALVDRGDQAKAELERYGVGYRPVITYRDLGIEPVQPAGSVTS
jgi:orotate phosphoribosyltransferase